MKAPGSQTGGATLGASFLRGGAYLSLGNWVTTLLSFLIGLGVARILGPAEFGVYAFVFALSELLTIIAAFALNQALVQSRDESQTLNDSAFALSSMLALVTITVGLAAAPLLSRIRDDHAAALMVMLATGRALQLLCWVPTALLERRVRYGAVAGIQMTAVNVPNLLGLGLAWYGFGAWSLAVRDVATPALHLVMALVASGYVFRRDVRRDSIRRLMDFSRPMFIARSLDILLQRVDRIILGSFLGDALLGLYHQAKTIAMTGTLATRPIFPLAFNLFSRVQDSPDQQRRAYEITTFLLSRPMIGIAAIFLSTPCEIIELLLGKEWTDAAPLLRGLALYSVLQPMFDLGKQLLYARAEAAKNIYLRLVQAALFIPCVAAAAWYDSVIGVIGGLTLGTMIAVWMASRFNRDIVAGVLPRVLFAPVLACAGSVAFVEIGRASDWFGVLPWQTLPVVPAATYLLLLIALEPRRLVRELHYIFRPLLERTAASQESDG